MREYMWHVGAGLLCFLAWLYCVNVMSERHAVDTSRELQFALLLLSSLCLTWAVIANILGSIVSCEQIASTQEANPYTETKCDIKVEQNENNNKEFSKKREHCLVQTELHCQDLSGHEKQYRLVDDEKRIMLEPEQDQWTKLTQPKTLLPNENWWLVYSTTYLSNKWLGSIISVSQIFLVIMGVHALKLILHFYFSYRILFCHTDLLLAVHMPACVCVVEVSIAVIYLLRKYLCEEETKAQCEDTEKAALSG